MSSRFSFAFAMLFTLFLQLVPFAQVHAGGTVAEPGDLIRGTTFSAVYYMGEDGFRYVFPNDKTYFTWYSDFSTVKMVSDADLATIQMGGNVTYHPGSKMVKINSDPKTYLVTHGALLRWISTEADAVAMYGADWSAKIDDVPDGFFTNYTVGDVVDLSSDTSSGALIASREFGGTSSISDDKELTDYHVVTIQNMMFNGVMDGDNSVTIYAGETVLFRNSDEVNHTATADDGSWGTGTLNSGETFVRRFDEAGTYTYHCGYHSEMTGTIVVNEAETM